MKISGTTTAAIAETIRSPTRAPKQAETSAPEQDDSVRLSDTATWVQQLQDRAAEMQSVRPEAVQEAKDAIANGTLESEEVFEAAVDALLADF